MREAQEVQEVQLEQQELGGRIERIRERLEGELTRRQSVKD